jgi:hypothetical protein
MVNLKRELCRSFRLRGTTLNYTVAGLLEPPDAQINSGVPLRPQRAGGDPNQRTQHEAHRRVNQASQ